MILSHSARRMPTFTDAGKKCWRDLHVKPCDRTKEAVTGRLRFNPAFHPSQISRARAMVGLNGRSVSRSGFAAQVVPRLPASRLPNRERKPIGLQSRGSGQERASARLHRIRLRSVPGKDREEWQGRFTKVHRIAGRPLRTLGSFSANRNPTGFRSSRSNGFRAWIRRSAGAKPCGAGYRPCRSWYLPWRPPCRIARRESGH